VVLCLDRAGIVGDDGPTHHGVFDLALLRSIPNLVLMQPSDGAELAHMLYTATQLGRPVVIRYPRGSGPLSVAPETFEALPLGKAVVVRAGWQAQIWALGDMLPVAWEAAERLAERGIACGVVNARFVVPLDEALLADQARTARLIATLENGVAAGGFGSALQERVADLDLPVRVVRFGWPAEFVSHGNPALLAQAYGLTARAIAESLERSLPRD
jgi:1-deoxy-D-xylulose-5-phosphate synthase